MSSYLCDAVFHLVVSQLPDISIRRLNVKIICHFLVYTFICRFINDQVGWLKEKEKQKHFIILFDN